MRIVVVYESMWGNTKTVAEGIAEGLAEAARGSADLFVGSVDEIAPEDAGVASLVVAGGPTHAHGMARPDARDSVRKMTPKHDYGPVLPGAMSLRAWLDRLPAASASGAAFDTRFDKPRWLTGSAAKGIARRLAGKGYATADTRSFFVRTTGGPLADGERERAVGWGRALGAQLVARAAV